MLLFTTWTRLPPERPKSETRPANSSVAPEATVAVAVAPTEGVPAVVANRSVPAETFVSPV